MIPTTARRTSSSLALLSLLLCSVIPQAALSFGGFDPALIHHSITSAGSAVDSFLHSSHNIISSAAPHFTSSSPAPQAPLQFPDVAVAANHLLNNYKQCLATNPLPTKMLTGAALATCGDAFAQSKEDAPYDKKRAASFAVFDMAYRGLQHASFPWIVQHCHGQFLTAGLSAMMTTGAAHTTTHAAAVVSPEMTNYFAAVEQTLASQLGIVPFFYYPVFFSLTGFIQGLSMEGSVERAKEKFFPLMQRNLMFWLPVQFVQFGFIEESLQIPFLSVCGLCWTFILSVAAGDANAKSSTSPATVNENEEELVVLATSEGTDSAVYQNQVGDLGVAVMESSSQPEAFGLDDKSEAAEAPYATTKDAALLYEKSY